jgi:hypothetical protein
MYDNLMLGDKRLESFSHLLGMQSRGCGLTLGASHPSTGNTVLTHLTHLDEWLENFAPKRYVTKSSPPVVEKRFYIMYKK